MCEGYGRSQKQAWHYKGCSNEACKPICRYVDLAQIVYLKILEWKQGHRPDEVANNFLYTIASNAADAYRKRKGNINRLQTSIYIYLRMLLTQI